MNLTKLFSSSRTWVFPLILESNLFLLLNSILSFTKFRIRERCQLGHEIFCKYEVDTHVQYLQCISDLRHKEKDFLSNISLEFDRKIRQCLKYQIRRIVNVCENLPNIVWIFVIFESTMLFPAHVTYLYKKPVNSVSYTLVEHHQHDDNYNPIQATNCKFMTFLTLKL